MKQNQKNGTIRKCGQVSLKPKIKISPFQLLSSLTTGYIDFRGIVCDPTKLKSYMFFPKSTNVSVVSKELCDIPDSAIPGITELVQQQIDIVSILRVVSYAMKLLILKGFLDL